MARWRGAGLRAYQAALGLHQRPVGAVHLVVQTACVAEVVSVAVPPPQGRRGGATVHTLTTLWGLHE